MNAFVSEANALKSIGHHFNFPASYLVLDTETSGFSKTGDFLIDVGWAVVKDNKIAHHTNLLLDWSKMPNVDHSYIQSQLKRQAASYAETGRPHYYPWERLCDEGEHPLEVLHAYSTLIYEHINNPDSVIVGHGFWRFDREFIDSSTQRFLSGYILPWKMNSILDTGLLEKAAQTNLQPFEAESLASWSRRVNNARAVGVKWNMDPHCVTKYSLNTRFSHDMRLMHTAGFDCLLIHNLLDTFRELVEILNGKRSQFSQQIPQEVRDPFAPQTY